MSPNHQNTNTIIIKTHEPHGPRTGPNNASGSKSSKHTHPPTHGPPTRKDGSQLFLCPSFLLLVNPRRSLACQTRGGPTFAPGTLANDVFLHCCVGLPRASPRVARGAAGGGAPHVGTTSRAASFASRESTHHPAMAPRLTLDSRACTASSAHWSCCAADRRGVARSNVWGAAAMRGEHRYIAAGRQLARRRP